MIRVWFLLFHISTSISYSCHGSTLSGLISDNPIFQRTWSTFCTVGPSTGHAYPQHNTIRARMTIQHGLPNNPASPVVPVSWLSIFRLSTFRSHQLCTRVFFVPPDYPVILTLDKEHERAFTVAPPHTPGTPRAKSCVLGGARLYTFRHRPIFITVALASVLNRT